MAILSDSLLYRMYICIHRWNLAAWFLFGYEDFLLEVSGIWLPWLGLCGLGDRPMTPGNYFELGMLNIRDSIGYF